ncbi:MAG: T9SS type A sorting domain-containing protein, partial [Fibrobacteres bacterium]|nr:T9SS type A sorting domain-containing protein [Fibrobacterota bacterium]
GTDNAFLYVHAVDKYRFGKNDAVTDTGNTRSDKSADLGTIWASDGTKGVGALTQYFWQMYPSSIEVNGAGEMNLGLFSHRLRGGSSAYPPRFADHYDIPSGMSKTHDIRIVFFNDDAAPEVKSSLVGAQSPLHALAPAAWYCRATKAMGPLVEKGNWSLFTPADSAIVAKAESNIWTNGLRCIGNTNAILGGKDAYDYLGWGDNPHYFNGPGNLYWNSNYYDLPILMYTHFVRTLDFRFLDYAYAHTSHIRDIHQCLFDASNSNDGACRYCPPTNHYGNEGLTPVVMNQTSHHKTQSMFYQYYMFGDYRSRDVGLRGVKWIKAKGTSENAEFACYTRRPANCMNTLLEGYKYNFDAGCLTVLNNFATDISNKLGTRGIPACGTTDQYWMAGLLGEAMVDAFEVTGNTNWMRLSKLASDSIPPSSATSNMAYCAAASWRYYDAPMSRTRSIGNLNKVLATYNNHEKDYAIECRSVPKAISLFAIPDSLNKKIAAETGSGLAPVETQISASPNPSNPATRLTVYGRNVGGKNVVLSVYAATGKKIWSVMGKADGVFQTEWNGNDAAGRQVASGSYIVRAEIGGQVVEKKIVLMR